MIKYYKEMAEYYKSWMDSTEKVGCENEELESLDDCFDYNFRNYISYMKLWKNEIKKLNDKEKTDNKKQLTKKKLIDKLLSDCTHKDIKYFIKELDFAVADWSCTEDMYKRYKQQYRDLYKRYKK